jgi:hypothetical protein
VSRFVARCAIAVAQVAAAGAMGCGEPRAPAQEAPYAVASVVLPPAPRAAPPDEAGAPPAAPMLAEHLGEPPTVDPRSRARRTFDGDAGSFRPPTPYAILVARDGNGFAGNGGPPPKAVRACITSARASLRLRVAVGADGGAEVTIDEQEGLDSPAVACVVAALRKDPRRWPMPDEGAVGFDVMVR